MTVADVVRQAVMEAVREGVREGEREGVGERLAVMVMLALGAETSGHCTSRGGATPFWPKALVPPQQ